MNGHSASPSGRIILKFTYTEPAPRGIVDALIRWLSAAGGCHRLKIRGQRPKYVGSATAAGSGECPFIRVLQHPPRLIKSGVINYLQS